MIIELRGVEFVNKGAELMLQSILQYVSKKIPDARFVMETSHRTPKAKLDAAGIWEKANFKKKGIDLSSLAVLLPKSYFLKRHLVMEKDIEVVFDASGFAYGDKWGAEKAAKRSGDHLAKWKSQGKKIIFLPQAFGPFSDPELKVEMGKILTHADLIFARDEKSFEYLKNTGFRTASLHLAPDFTNLVTVDTNKFQQEFGDKVVIIPNQKMLETEDPVKNEGYKPFLTCLINLLIEKGETPVFLIHESKKDGLLAEEINSVLSSPIEIVKKENSMEVKGIIGAARGVITSRFHGLVSALSQQVPCLSTGWSHKYMELMKDYDYISGMCEVSDNLSFLDEKLDLILSSENRKNIIEKLNQKGELQKELSKKMWQKVIDLLK
jgi:colanic acid/amylovoran biosynthesis protein